MQYCLSFQAVGAGPINECRYALLKILALHNLKPPATIRLFIYTDDQAAFDAYTSFFPHFTMSNDMPTSKTELITSLAKRECEVSVFSETHVYPTRPLHEFFEGMTHSIYYLPSAKAKIKNARLQRSLQNKPVQLNERDLSKLDFSFTTSLIVFRNENAALLQDMRSLSESLFGQTNDRQSEDLAISYMLQKKGAVSAANAFTDYGNFPEFSNLLNLFFTKNEEESIPNLVKLIHHLDLEQIQEHKNQYENLPFYKKLLDRLRGRRWSIRQYEKKI